MVAVADLINESVAGHDRDAEQIRVGFGQLGDIGRNSTFPMIEKFGMQFGDQLPERVGIDQGGGGGHGAPQCGGGYGGGGPGGGPGGGGGQ